MTLDLVSMNRVVRGIPSIEEFGELSFGALEEVVDHLLRAEPLGPDVTLTAPDFDQKIAFNGLSPAIASLLYAGALETGDLDRYFDGRPDYARTRVRDRLRTIYLQLLPEYGPLVCPGNADRILLGFYPVLTPDGKKGKATQAAIGNLLAYFFEACDIFEEPK